MNTSCPLLDMQHNRIRIAIENCSGLLILFAKRIYYDYSNYYDDPEDDYVRDWNDEKIADVIYAHGWRPYQYYQYREGQVNTPSDFGFK